ncbi:nitroreductase family deazaflavin-dependent oxidoreductase [Nocardioides insulae]|uniref:nitroreductase family deazaflavin-dependent oxidoreductase n=1 Tax=Nocardioides insulae TaxID=394734 RepID=UPI00041D04F9|nr:nitroreductase family deazaflavin-dependent oxidoreductase [Nocardioides insulae]
MRLVRRLFIGVLGVAALLTAVFLVGMRRKSPWLLERFTRFQRDVGRKWDLETGGTQGRKTGLIHHVGRRSGTPYVTPIGPHPAPGGYVINLPYTSRSDWARNVLAAGEATLDLDGRSHRLTEPRIISADEALPLLPRGEQVVARLFDVREFLRVTVAD